jgi:hypothetical protein
LRARAKRRVEWVHESVSTTAGAVIVVEAAMVAGFAPAADATWSLSLRAVSEGLKPSACPRLRAQSSCSTRLMTLSGLSCRPSLNAFHCVQNPSIFGDRSSRAFRWVHGCLPGVIQGLYRGHTGMPALFKPWQSPGVPLLNSQDARIIHRCSGKVSVQLPSKPLNRQRDTWQPFQAMLELGALFPAELRQDLLSLGPGRFQLPLLREPAEVEDPRQGAAQIQIG